MMGPIPLLKGNATVSEPTDGSKFRQAAQDLELQLPDSIDVQFATADEAAYQLMLYRLNRFTGQTVGTIDAYVKRYQAQWVSRPEQAPDWRTVESDIVRRVSLGESIDWLGFKPDVPIFR